MTAGPDYEPLGAWWTYNAPSVRVADARHEYLSIWTAGESGASVLLVAGDHRVWEPVVPRLTEHFLVHAVDLRPAPIAGHADVDGVCTALAAVGARLVIAAGDAARAVLPALDNGAVDRVVLWDPAADVTAAPGVVVVPSGGRTPDAASDVLVAALRGTDSTGVGCPER